MNRRRTSLAGSPVLIGAATALIALVAVVLSYNANKGLPFITTYDINAEVADAKKLTTSVDVRIGGKRVGQVSEIKAMKGADGRYFSRLSLKLDRTIAELPVDTRLRIRPKSVIGAKFVELYPGRSSRTIAAGGTIPEADTSASVDLDEVTGLFDANLRRSYRTVIKEAANGVAGRGSSLNEGIDALPPTLSSGSRFLSTLADPATNLSGFIRGLDATTQAVLPATNDLGALFAAAAPTFRAIGAENEANGQSLQLLPSVEDATISASRVAAPVLRDAAALARELRPGVRALPRTVRSLDRAIDRGVPILRRAPVLGTELQSTLRVADRTLQRQSFGDSLTLLTPTLQELLPPLQLLETQQVKCNYVGLFARNASSAGSAGDENGNWLRISLGVSADQTLRSPNPDPRLHYQVYPDNDQGPNGQGGCAVGQEAYTSGKVIGRVPGQVSQSGPPTSAPAGTPKGPR